MRARTPGTSTWPTTPAAGRNSRSGSASTSCSPPRPRAPSRPTRTPTTSSRPSSPPKPRPPPHGRPSCAKPPGSRPAPMSSRRCASSARWSRPSPREGDEAAQDELTRRAGGYVQADVDAWLAQALAAHRGHYADPAAREAAASLLPQPVLAYVALLSALARLVPAAAPGELTFAARLATAEPEATADLAALLTRATESADTSSSCSPTAPSTRGPNHRSVRRTTPARTTPTTTRSATARARHAPSAWSAPTAPTARSAAASPVLLSPSATSQTSQIPGRDL